MKTINTALCSFGMSGWVFHGPFIDLHPNFNLYAVFERNKNLAEEKYPNVTIFRSLNALLSDDTIDLVVVNTPNITHYEYAKKCLEAGKHVVVEKPFTVTSSEAEELIALAHNKNLKLSVFHNRRWDSDFLTVKKVLESGVLGDIVEAEIHYDRFEPELSYKTHKETPTEGVGSLYDLGSHIIDQALQLFGIPKSVFATLDSFRKDSKVGDYFDVKLYYQAHYVTLKSSYFVREPLPAYSLHGTLGSFVKSKADVQETDLQKHLIPNRSNWGIEQEKEKGILHVIENGEFKKSFVNTEQGNYMRYYDNIADAILHNKQLAVTDEEATDVIRIIEAAMQSNQENRVIDL